MNANGLLAAWYFKNDTTTTLGAWRNGIFIGDVGPAINVYAVTDDDQLAGSRGPTPWRPVTFSCVS